jgi:hypothetical protein
MRGHALAVLAVALSLLSIGVHEIWRASVGRRQEVTLTNIQHDQGFAYTAKIRRPELSPDDGRSQVLEDGRLLGPRNQQHADIRDLGHGRFYVWGAYVYLSSSDNTDPRSNGRHYTMRMTPISPLAARILYAVTLVVVFAAGLKHPTFGYVALTIGYVALRVVAFAGAHYTEFSDSPSYFEKAATTLLDPEFYIGSGRFFVVPLMYKGVATVAGSEITSLTVFQLALSVCAWMTLASVYAAKFARRWLGLCMFAVILALSLSTDVLIWDRVILSESISTSLFALLLACWIRLGHAVTIPRIAALAIVSLCWGFAREANSTLLVPFAAALFWWSIWYLGHRRHEQRRSLIVVGAWLAIAAATSLVSARGDRWFFPMLNVVGTRILPSPERFAYYQARGMPVTDRLIAMSGEYGGGQDWAFYKSPELESFRDWLKAHGREVYAEDLWSHPVRSVVEPISDVQSFVCPDLTQYRPVGVNEILPQLGQSHVCGPRASRAVVVGSLIIGIGLFLAAAIFRHRLSAVQGLGILIAAGMLLGWVPVVWLIWHAIGGMETSRHVLAGTMALRLAIVILLGEAINLWAAPRVRESS